MPPTSALILGVVLPIFAASIFWLGWFVQARRHQSSSLNPIPESPTEPRWASDLAAVAVGSAFLTAFYTVDPFSPFPPILAPNWLFYSAIALTLLAAAEGLLRPSKWYFKLPLWLLAAALIVIPLSNAWRTGFDSTGNPRHWLPTSAAVGGWIALSVLFRSALGRLGCASPIAGVWTLGLTSALTAVLLGLSGSQFAMPFRAASLGLALLPLLPLYFLTRKSPTPLPLPAPALTAWSFLTFGVLLTGYLWYELTPYNALLILAGPTLAALIPTRSAWPRIAGGLLPVLIALTLALIAFARAESADPYGY